MLHPTSVGDQLYPYKSVIHKPQNFSILNRAVESHGTIGGAGYVGWHYIKHYKLQMMKTVKPSTNTIHLTCIQVTLLVSP